MWNNVPNPYMYVYVYVYVYVYIYIIMCVSRIYLVYMRVCILNIYICVVSGLQPGQGNTVYKTKNGVQHDFRKNGYRTTDLNFHGSVTASGKEQDDTRIIASCRGYVSKGVHEDFGRRPR